MTSPDWGRIDQDWTSSKRAILAYHLGGWQKGESPLEALARALGVTSKASDLFDYTQELAQLSACLDADLDDDLSLNESVALTVSLLNEKLEDVPAEVRAFFGAPLKLEPLPLNCHECCVARA